MPPKTPIRIPIKPPAAAKPSTRTAPKAPSKAHAPQTRPAASPRLTPPPSLPRWYQNPTLRTRAFYTSLAAHMVLINCAYLWVRDHYVVIERVQGSSMAPTISPTAHETGKGDSIIIRPYRERPAQRQAGTDGWKDNASGLQRGDVVTFWKPHKPEETAVKRVVAIEGDTVYPKRGYALNPEARRDRVPGLPDGLPDTDSDAITTDANELGKVVVPYGHVWIEGDNWRQSLDSNDFGPISKGLIMGKAVWIWRDWFSLKEVGDERVKKDKDMMSQVVKGKSEIPAIFLE